MRSKLRKASIIAVAATMTTLAIGAGDTDASAQDHQPEFVQPAPATTFVSEPVLQPIPEMTEEELAAQAVAEEAEAAEQAAQISASSLSQLVAAQPRRSSLSREMRCLAGAIYFEARGESLAGQLAVGRVIVARARSGRFPDSYCGVVYQRSQFSFVRGNSMPSIRTGSSAWKNATAIAQIAASGGWESPAEGALFFHAAHVSPGWHLKRIARVDNHVFYR